MATFEELVVSRKDWIESVLKPWVRAAPVAELRKAEAEWTDIAGRAGPDETLWTWAWGRFPPLVHDELPGVNETQPVRVRLKSGEQVEGFPDARRTAKHQLYLFAEGEHLGPYGLDQVDFVEPLDG